MNELYEAAKIQQFRGTPSENKRTRDTRKNLNQINIKIISPIKKVYPPADELVLTLWGLKIRNETFFSDPKIFLSQIEE